MKISSARVKKYAIDFPIEITRFGFIYGPAHVERIFDDKKYGVFIAVITNREHLEIRITPGGKISIYSHENSKCQS